MDTVLTIFWGLLIFSFLVFIHEGGHFLAARAFGARVLEFFIGFPSQAQLAFNSKKIGTRFGVTPLLFGGYARISGMDMGEPNPNLSAVLQVINVRGEASVADVAHILSLSNQDAADALVNLESWGSIRVKPGMHIDTNQEKTLYQTMARDSSGRTIYDGAQLGALQNEAGEPYLSDLSSEDQFAFERKQTYVGLSPLKRIIVLLSGIIINLLFAFIIFVAVFMVSGVALIDASIKEVQADSIAATQGIEAGDTILSIAHEPIDSGKDLLQALQNAKGKGSFEIVYLDTSNNKEITFNTELKSDETLGIVLDSHLEKQGFVSSAKLAVENMVFTAIAIANLLNPARFMDTISQSSSVIGIAVLAKDAAQAGFVPFLTLAAAISLSLGLMNLLPIPPLDGGKVLIEIIQAAIGRPISQKTQVGISLLGIAFFIVLFVILLGQDISRIAS
ncbi:MAG: site-2 protease family protein [Coriobacteriia bacterium]|nr:site-2 protease family protein [Coriobacteriia bacterium]